MKYRNTHHNRKERIIMKSNKNLTLDPDAGVLDHWPVRAPDVRSGMVTHTGVVLKVDRCAPEHGGGIILWFPLSESGSWLGPDQHIHVVGYVTDEVLDTLRNVCTEATRINYYNGIR